MTVALVLAAIFPVACYSRGATEIHILHSGFHTETGTKRPGFGSPAIRRKKIRQWPRGRSHRGVPGGRNRNAERPAPIAEGTRPLPKGGRHSGHCPNRQAFPLRPFPSFAPRCGNRVHLLRYAQCGSTDNRRPCPACGAGGRIDQRTDPRCPASGEEKRDAPRQSESPALFSPRLAASSGGLSCVFPLYGPDFTGTALHRPDKPCRDC